MQNDGEQIAVEGHVKWFDPGKGFGFVVSAAVSTDILLHANVLRNFGQSSVLDGAAIRLTVQITTRGAQAVEILSIVAPDLSQSSDRLPEDMPFDTELIGGPLAPARVKWFDRGKGFGFANVFGNSDDVFIHVEVLRRSGLADLQPGEAVGLRVADGKRGKLATEVTSWESASENSD
ncbi:cold-shock protein [Oceaniglobus ichthyenteri]|uniref:cold-shock protein n=1 Tax=Oceaniglobus ichthyenteri TaxID=2136177 RepID=UPI001F0C12F1|nr:cold shock domain-containing protein [Oceaniglobus ichthyenteri]